MNHKVEYSHESATTHSCIKSPAPRRGRSIEPCTCAPTARLDEPAHARDWEIQDNRELLWEQEIHRTNGGDSRSIAWLSLYYGCNGTRHEHDGESPCSFVVAMNDSLARRQCQVSDGCWLHDITSSPLGQDILDFWIALNPEKHAALPKNYKEWHERGRRAWFEGMAADLKESGIDITGMSEEEVHGCWTELQRKCRPAELEGQGWSPEQIAQKMSEEFGERP